MRFSCFIATRATSYRICVNQPGRLQTLENNQSVLFLREFGSIKIVSQPKLWGYFLDLKAPQIAVLKFSRVCNSSVNGMLCLIGRKGSQSRKKILPKLKRALYLYTNGDIGRFQYRHCKVPPVFIPVATGGFYNVLYNSYSGIFSPKALPEVF